MLNFSKGLLNWPCFFWVIFGNLYMHLYTYQSKHKLSFLAFCLLFILGSTQVFSANIIYSVDYEDGTTGVTNPAGNPPTNSSAYAVSGTKSGLFYLNQNTSRVPHRTEVTLGSPGFFKWGQEYWLGMNVRFEDWDFDSSAEIGPLQIHTRPSDYTKECNVGAAVSTAPFLFITKGDEIRFITYPGRVLWRAPIVKNQWQNIVIRFNISLDSSGFTELWVDGDLKGRTDGKGSPATDKCGKPMRPTYYKMGIYKWDWKAYKNKTTDVVQREMYIDDFILAEGASGYDLVGGTSGGGAPAVEPPLPVFTAWSQDVDRGTLEGGAALTPEHGVKFDGIDGYVDIGKIDIPADKMTLSAWVNTSDLDNCVNSDCRIISKASGTADADHIFMLSTIKVGADYFVRARIRIGGVAHTLTAAFGKLKNDEWMHVGATFDGSFMRTYQGGNNVGSMAVTGNIDQDPSMDVWLGGNPGDATARPWKGYITRAQIFNDWLDPDAMKVLAGSPPPSLEEPEDPTNVLPVESRVDACSSFHVETDINGVITVRPIPGEVAKFTVLPSE